MASMLKRAMHYLGLGPDDEYDELDPYQVPTQQPVPHSVQPAPPPAPAMPEQEGASVRTLSPASPTPRVRPAVRPIASNARVEAVAPTSFNEAQEVADHFKASKPVIVNLQGAPRELSRRLIDFTSGLCYGLGGQMERVADNVYLLTPTNVEVSAEERRRLQERGLYDDGDD